MSRRGHAAFTEADMNRGTGVASAMFFYAMLLVGGGLTAYVLAPAGANAKTALSVPVACAGGMVLSALLALQIDRARVIGMIGVTLGLALPLVFAAAIGFRAVKTGDSIDAWRTAEREWATAVERSEVEGGQAARSAFFDARAAPDHDKSYLRNSLW